MIKLFVAMFDFINMIKFHVKFIIFSNRTKQATGFYVN